MHDRQTKISKFKSLANRESFVLRNLTDCSVYLLDFSGEVEVSNVVNSQIFIGKLTISSMGLTRTFLANLGHKTHC